jgi:hypothetical protein
LLNGKNWNISIEKKKEKKKVTDPLVYRPSPKDNRALDLPFLGRLLQVELPTPLKPQLLETAPFDMNKLQPDTQVSLYYWAKKKKITIGS